MPRTYTLEGKRTQRWTKAHTERAIELRKQGLFYAAIAQELGFTAKTVKKRLEESRAKPQSEPPQPLPNIVPPRRIMNSASREVYVPKQETPLRPGAMDYAAVRSRGI